MKEPLFVDDTNVLENKKVGKNETLMGFLWVCWLFNAICIYNLQG